MYEGPYVKFLHALSGDSRSGEITRAIDNRAGLNKSWFQQRPGWINFKAATCTNPRIPSQSLIKQICYLQVCKFSTESTRYYLSFSVCLSYMVESLYSLSMNSCNRFSLCPHHIHHFYFCLLWCFIHRWGCCHQKDAITPYSATS